MEAAEEGRVKADNKAERRQNRRMDQQRERGDSEKRGRRTT